MKTITPEQQILETMRQLKIRIALSRQQQPTSEIRALVTQLDIQINSYFRGELEPIILNEDDIPF